MVISVTGCLLDAERLGEWELGGVTEVLEENPSQCHFFHHTSHMT
jgi:hypothetical protein